MTMHGQLSFFFFLLKVKGFFFPTFESELERPKEALNVVVSAKWWKNGLNYT